MNKNAKIYVAGHRGMVGSAIVRKLQADGYDNLVLRTRKELDLCEQQAVREFFAAEKPNYVVDAAAKVGGIMANDTLPADFIHDNLVIQANIIHEAWAHGVQKFLFLGSSCIYPKMAEQPIREDSLLTGPLEPTNQWYAIAKIAGIRMCQAYRRQHGFNAISAMPTNLYGPNDNFNLATSHVLPALMRKMHEAKVAGQDSVEIWGSGSPLREFLHVDDLAAACVFLMNEYEEEDHVNVGAGEDLTIKALAELIQDVVGFKGTLAFDTSKPDGTPKKLMDSTRINALGWKPEISLQDGVASTYEWFQENVANSE